MMTAPKIQSPLTRLSLIALALLSFIEAKAANAYQYHHENVAIPAAGAAEPKRETFSLSAALTYLDEGARAWSKERQCVSCHTNGSYLLTRPSLTQIAGPPRSDVRTFFESELAEFQNQTVDSLKKGITPTQIAYLAAGLANWDRHINRKLSQASSEALTLMLAVQSENGAFANDDAWPPLESSEYQGATVAALALLAAPEWPESPEAANQAVRIHRLWDYLRNTPPPHDYCRTLLLWVATQKLDLIPDQRRDEIIKRLLDLQRPDGGWAIRSFATPERWGRGNRAEKLHAEGDYETPESDGHQTGLTAFVLMKAGIPASDPTIQKALEWLQCNQRESGRWWTRSLNTDKFHFITYSGTCYPLLALAEAGALSQLD